MMLSAADIKCSYALLREVLVENANEDVYACVLQMLANGPAKYIRGVVRKYVNERVNAQYLRPRRVIPKQFTLDQARGIYVRCYYDIPSKCLVVDISWMCSKNKNPDISSELTGRPIGHMSVAYDIPMPQYRKYWDGADVPLLIV